MVWSICSNRIIVGSVLTTMFFVVVAMSMSVTCSAHYVSIV